MNNKQFYKKLQERLPQWQMQGWLDEKSANAILNDAYSEADTSNFKAHKMSFILGIMGVILLAVGAISFFAANWQGMSKLIKLTILFSSMTFAYLATAWALSSQKYFALGQAFLLLGVLLFGNNIMLIAQIYHIDSHYPNGVLLWVAGALLTAIIMKSEVVLVAGVLLSLIWTGMKIFDFRQIHWPWLIFWAAVVWLAIREGFHLASHLIVLSLFLWLLFYFNSFTRYASEDFLVQIYLLIGLLIVMLAETLKCRQHVAYFVEHLSYYALIFSFIFLYILSFPDLNLYSSVSYSNTSGIFKAQLTWMLIHLVLMGAILMFTYTRLKGSLKAIPLFKWLAVLWLLILFVSLFLNVYFYQEQQSITVIMVNLLLFFLVIGLIYFGLSVYKRFYVNAAFILFSITLLSRYFDTFWSLMDRSVFFIVGGLLLIIGGYWLEKKDDSLINSQ
ncbi:MAG: DUF2157 domain-containing protein [gamma proteobacterium symbiont of Bathyaustriella thionipta]|nr:DUF2157 domain-containing protein [gamma proteobacterium symbiont of Bathyaustriella thionipta]MCU7951246.1 DUF2157 domain-containing protein [gamma proteobacterium symbiont of Bathyaustriella thionipta]MCU7953401.1 DUF2157 domain-containing protein [gamma proteobacterium symbiont of Bathyaustriella thionipta]MCU7957772.1 DUF2157 domain-containing protein [gamma proteobacterium symbiont of Bathyaustriella thionipta]MCU7966143.1 DUF2157 domain-containing protein [gamma proteobacterium symbion